MHATQPATELPLRFVFDPKDRADSGVGAAINRSWLRDEAEVMGELMELARQAPASQKRIRETAGMLVEAVRKNRGKAGGIDAFMSKYDLSSQEGVVLMCLAEALLRVPDAETADKLIADKIAAGNWREHLGTSDSAFVNFSTWGLMLTGRIMRPEQELLEHPNRFMKRMVSRLGEPVARNAMRQAMRIMGHQFVMGRTITEALKRSTSGENAAYRYSFDMLGEAALTAADAERYLHAYEVAIKTLGGAVQSGQSVFEVPSISVKLSALFPRYEFAQRRRTLDTLVPRLHHLAVAAKDAGIALTVDAEESERLELSLEIFAAVYQDKAFHGWEGLGLALQAYQRRCLDVVRWVIAQGREAGRRIPTRLVKGAYWDTEIKHAQERGHAGYPVFTRKVNTDVAYIACAAELLASRDAVYPQFATHNAQTLATVLHLAGDDREFEFQRLHGMGEELYAEVVGPQKMGLSCRVYAPVGPHEDLLPYLVRRLLENGANTSFVNRIVDEQAPLDDIVADPAVQVSELSSVPHPRIPLPAGIFSDRTNSYGVNLADPGELGQLAGDMSLAMDTTRIAMPVVGGKQLNGSEVTSVDPMDNRRIIGHVRYASEEATKDALDLASKAQPGWNDTPAPERARILRAAANLFEANQAELLALCIREAGKTLPDSVSELREAVDFLRYYATEAEKHFDEPLRMPGPTGESNDLELHGRGVFLCISPWNFPLAIFTGQVSAALAAGNAVLAKPAEQTSLVAARAVALLHEAGVPVDVLHLLPGLGPDIGGWLLPDGRVAGVAFTGSTETARIINRQLAERDGPLAALIAETGGQNAMLVDSSALPEQVVLDVVQSSFNSAGQRCSALRVLFLQEEIAPRVIDLLRGYMDELTLGDPGMLDTDVGPVIDREALEILEKHAAAISERGKVIHRCKIPEQLKHGTYFAPLAVEIDDLSWLEREVFGPILHVVRYKAKDLDKVIDQINATGYGLTLGVHSRIDSTARHIHRRAKVGNVYVNRNIIGAVVGVQPFGGCGLSGTGPKAGGPDYLLRYANERTLTINTAAVGGNASLLSLGSD